MKKLFLVLFILYSAVILSACARPTRAQADAGAQALKALEAGKNYLRLAIQAADRNDDTGACAYTSKAIDIVRAIDQSALADNDRKIISDTLDFGSSARDKICKAAGGKAALIIKKRTQPTPTLK